MDCADFEECLQRDWSTSIVGIDSREDVALTAVRESQGPPSCPKAQASSQAAEAEDNDKISTAVATNAAAISLIFTK